ncbi:MAG: tRNA lysidine(34) synthetase TilS [Spirochaetae bacterium HGW-Spirochaetae-1]|jgi:tRNA(Ile)-lysidine synthase|nr:MAG: tRNA lysidine(34) synthetase TilS [Spirochaetae bacterium HGW-Spirochaetae-1]
MHDIIKKVINFVEGEHLLASGDRVLLSCSAGKDSMAMLHLMAGLRDILDVELGIFHLNHLMRGEASDFDEKFLEERARFYKIPFMPERFDFKKRRDPGYSFEEQARKIRYALAQQTADRYHYTKIATAHSKNDNAETLMMRILSGTGIHGLQGIHASRDMIIRPLLTISSEDIVRYLEENGLSWRDDDSNADNGYLRNHMRNVILPVIRERYPAFLDSLHTMSRQAGEQIRLTDRLIAENYGQLVEQDNEGITLSTYKIDDDRVLFNHVLSSVIRRHAGPYVNSGMLNEIWKKYNTGKSHMILYKTGDIRMRKFPGEAGKLIRIEKAGQSLSSSQQWIYPVEIDETGCRTLGIPEAGIEVEIFFSDFDYFEENRLDKNHIFVTISSDDTTFYIRNRRKGDRIHLGSGTKKIKELFIEKKLDNESKNCVPLLIFGAHIAAVMTGFTTGFQNRISIDHMINDGSNKILVIRKM